jgi:hypothetical protein
MQREHRSLKSVAGAESQMKKSVLAALAVLGLGAAFFAASYTAQAQSAPANFSAPSR